MFNYRPRLKTPTRETDFLSPSPSPPSCCCVWSGREDIFRSAYCSDDGSESCRSSPEEQRETILTRCQKSSSPQDWSRHSMAPSVRTPINFSSPAKGSRGVRGMKISWLSSKTWGRTRGQDERAGLQPFFLSRCGLSCGTVYTAYFFDDRRMITTITSNPSAWGRLSQIYITRPRIDEDCKYRHRK